MNLALQRVLRRRLVPPLVRMTMALASAFVAAVFASIP